MTDLLHEFGQRDHGVDGGGRARGRARGGVRGGRREHREVRHRLAPVELQDGRRRVR